MVSFENFVKSMPPSLSELKVTPSFCFPIKIRDDPTASSKYVIVQCTVNSIKGPSVETSSLLCKVYKYLSRCVVSLVSK